MAAIDTVTAIAMSTTDRTTEGTVFRAARARNDAAIRGQNLFVHEPQDCCASGVFLKCIQCFTRRPGKELRAPSRTPLQCSTLSSHNAGGQWP